MYKFTTGEVFEAIRLESGLKQAEVAKKLDVAQSTISKMERNFHEDVSFGLILGFCDLVGYDIKYFQSGFINKIPSRLAKNINSKFIGKDGFSVRLAYEFVKKIDEKVEKDLYKLLKIKKSLFVFSSFKFTPHFFKFLQKHFPSEYEEAKEQILLEIPEKSDTKDISSIIHHFNSFKIEELSNMGNLVVLSFKNSTTSQIIKDTESAELSFLETCLDLNKRFSYEVKDVSDKVLLKVS
ncbi:MAG: helix-turn-helix domain-containing protein [Bacteriovoracaceae bacterium]|jgi:transcriptional regulator with XRE-family HTH domain|nr:helix-turn-helix domain-containing protein [Bacteriovoracaceae bacterium]